jgi:hypothetical protein
MQGKIKALKQFGDGGWISGNKHSQGGVNINAEGGEFMVKSKSAMKHKSLIEAINRDDQVSMNRAYITNLKNGVLSARVSLDDSADLKAIRELMEKKGKQVEFKDGYRIEKQGSTITRIRLN